MHVCIYIYAYIYIGIGIGIGIMTQDMGSNVAGTTCQEATPCSRPGSRVSLNARDVDCKAARQ